MSEILLTRTASGVLAPLDDDEAEKLRRIKTGAVVTANIVQMRNGKFFRKWWALAKFAYDIWSETMPGQEYKGILVRPTFNRFRKDLTIMTGRFTATYAVNGDVRLEADSLSWSSMDEDTFEALYSTTIDVILGKVLANSGLTEEAIRAHVDRVMQFDS